MLRDQAARARPRPRRARTGGSRASLPIYNTEFGFQTNPPDPFVSTAALRARREILNEKEEFSYRYSRLKSYSQYLLYDDARARRARPSALGRLPDAGCASRAARRSRPMRRTSSRSWCTSAAAACRSGAASRPGTGARFVQLQRKRGQRFVNDGSRIQTNPLGYFSVKRPFGSYRFLAYGSASGSTGSGAAIAFLGKSRIAKPTR